MIPINADNMIDMCSKLQYVTDTSNRVFHGFREELQIYKYHCYYSDIHVQALLLHGIIARHPYSSSQHRTIIINLTQHDV